MNTQSHSEMSDDDFMKQLLPETGEASSVESQANTTENTETGEGNSPDPENANPDPAANVAADPDIQKDPAEGENNGEGDGKPPVSGSETKPEGENKAADPADPAAEKQPVDPAAEKTTTPAEGEGTQTPPNYEQMYQEIMKPFTANGKKIELKTPQEAVALMQMGANYTRKMQEIAPHRKILTMLDKVDLLNEDKLSFLIDLDKGDPEAIKRFIKDKGIDPLDIDTTTEPAYRGGSHKVSDEEQKFQTALDELNSTPEGQQTLKVVTDTWDQPSKAMLWQQPEVLAIIDAQRQIGIYDRIVTEIDRRKTLGQMPSDKPFMEAYHAIGDELDKQGAFADIVNKQAEATGQSTTTAVDNSAGKSDPQPVATRTHKPKPDAGASKAAAAAPSRSTPGAAKPVVNVLAMSDEDFMKLDGLPS